MKNKRYILLGLLFISFRVFSANINGPSPVTNNTTTTYTYNSGSLILGPQWVVTKGTVTGSWVNGTLYTVNINWTSTGTGTITLKNFSTTFATKNVTVNDPALVAGSIGNAQTLCYNGNPGTLTNTGSASGGNGSYSYQWQKSTTSSSSGFSNVSGATSTTYNPPALTQSTWYKRKVTSGSQTEYSNVIKVTIYGNLSAGSIGNAQTLCYNGNPGTLTNTELASGGVSLTYRWQKSTTSSSSGFSDISVNGTSSTYDPPALTQSTWYRRKVTSGSGCGTQYTSAVKVTIHGNLSSGSISNAQTICYSGNPAALTNTGSASGGTSLTYQWEKSTTSSSSGFSNVSGATSTTYDPPTLTQDTWYRRKVTSGSSCGTQYTGAVKITVRGDLTPGVIGNAQTMCYNGNPSSISNTSSASGGVSLTYQWEKSTTSSSSGFSNVSGATSTTYDPPTLTQDTWYRRKVTSGSGCGTEYTNAIKVTIYGNLAAGSIGNAQTKCYNGNPSALTNTGSATGGTSLTYQWEKSTTSSSSGFSNVSGATSTTYDPPALTQDTWYRRKVTSGSGCGTQYTSAVKMTIYDNLTAGSVGNAQTKCYNGNPSALTNTGSASGGTSLTYQWEQSTTSSSSGFSNVSGATSTTYDPPALTQDTWYRRKVTSGSGCGTQYTSAVKMTIYDNVSAGSIGNAQTVCYNGNPSALSNSDPATGGVSLAYQWEQSTTSSSSGFSNVGGATLSTYDPPALTQSTWYRRKVTSGSGCGTQYTGTVKVTVYNNLAAGSIGNAQTICYSGNPGALTNTGSASGGTSLSYQWEKSTTSSSSGFSNVSGATSTTYDPSTLTQDTWYRRKVTSGAGCGTGYTSAVKVTVHDDLTAGLIGNAQTLCYNSDPTAVSNTSSASGGVSLTYQWEKSTTSSSSGFSTISGATSTTYDPSELTQDTWYKRKVTSGSGCGTEYTAPIKMTIYDPIVPGSVGNAQSLCYNGDPGTLTNTGSATGGTSLTYQWEKSITSASTGFTTVSGQTSSTYNPPALTQDTWYRRKVTSGAGCGSDETAAVKVTIYGDLTPGSIGNAQTICYNGNPSALTNTGSASGGTGISYQWESSTTSSSTGFTTVSGATSTTYDPPALTQDTWYRRKVTSGAGCGTEYTAAIKITVHDQLTAGSISGTQTICYNGDPSALSNTDPAAGGTSLTYQWQKSTTSASSGFTDIGVNGTSSTYDPPALTQDTWYRRKVTSGSGCGTAYTGAIKVTVYGNLSAGSIGNAQTICYNNDPAALSNTGSASGGTALTYQWESSTTSSSTGFTSVSGATSTTYDPPALSQDTWYRRKVTSGSGCGSDETAAIKITVYDELTPGIIGNAQTLCYNSDPGALTSTAAAAGGTGLTYQWESSTTSASSGFTDISGATSETYDPSELTQDTWYRRKVNSASGCGSDHTNVIEITIYDEVIAGTIGNAQTLCYDGNPGTLTNTASATGGTSLTYQWEQSTTSASSGFTNVGGETSTTYDPPTLTQDTWYRRKVTSGAGCGSDETTAVKITIYGDLTPGSIGNAQSVCHSGNPSALTNTASAAGGTGLTYQWESSTTSSSTGFTDVSGATSTTYDPPALTQDTWYKRTVTSAAGCGTDETSAVMITVYDELLPGSISGAQDICSGGDPAELTNSSLATGGVSLAYQWESSTTSASSGFSNVSGATASSYNPSALTQDTWYRRKVTSGLSCGSDETAAVKVTVNPIPGIPSGNDNGRCQSGTVSLGATAGTNGNSIKWYATAESTTSLFTGVNYTTPSISSNTTYYAASYNSTTQCESTLRKAITAEVSAFPTLGAIDASANQHWVSTNDDVTGYLVLREYAGQLDHWEEQPDGGSWTTITSSAIDSINYSIDETTSYKAFLVNDYCTTPMVSDSLTVEVTPIHFAGQISGSSSTTGSTNSTILALINYQGTVVNWQWSNDGYKWSAIVETNDTLTITNTSVSKFYRATVTYQGVEEHSTVHTLNWYPTPDMTLTSENYVKEETYLKAETNVSNLSSLANTEKVTSYTYTDGLGRARQSVVKHISPSLSDMITFSEYDNLGRSTKSYLPYTDSASNYYSTPTTAQAAFYNGTTNIPTDAAPYAETKYDDSPLQRILEQGAPGSTWQLEGGHTPTFAYRHNTTADSIRKWDAGGASTSTYAANTLFVNELTDENGHKVLTYTDQQGKQILKKTQAGASVYLYTYNVYDEYNRLVYTISPKAYEAMVDSASYDVSDAGMSDLIFSYLYDSLGRLIEKNVPGTLPTYYVYDSKNRAILTQDGNARKTKQWSFVKSDRKGRPVYSGLYADTTNITRAAMQAIADTLDYTTGSFWYEEVNSDSVIGYTNRVFPTQNTTVLTVNYYDHYDFDRNDTTDYSYNANHLTGAEANTMRYTRGLPTGSKTRILGSDDWLQTVVFYDEKGRAIQTLSNNHENLALEDTTSAIFDYTGKVLETLVEHKKDSVSSLKVKNRYSYDHTGRLLKLYQQNNTDDEVLMAAYDYNELGQQINKKLHSDSVSSGGAYLQSVDFAYNIRGWLKSINDPDNLNDDQYWGMELYHDDAITGMTQTKAYNGNISAMKWGSHPSDTTINKAYAYSYDDMDRLTTANYAEGSSLSTGSDKYKLSGMAYDANGNITDLIRYAPDTVGVAKQVDSLSYTYSGNQLSKVADSKTDDGFLDGANSGNDYAYDDMGNLLKDENKGIDTLIYNVLNKVDSIHFSDGRAIKYIYSAAGQKLTVKNYLNDTTLSKTTDYIGNAIYEDDSLSLFGTAEGRVIKNPYSGDLEYEYALSDHTGNTRVVFNATAKSDSFTATFEDADYTADTTSFFNVINRVSYPPGGKASRINNADIVGPGISLLVYPGDTLDMGVKVYYESSSGYGTSPIGQSALASAVSAAFGGLDGGSETEQFFHDLFTGSAVAGTLLTGNNGVDTEPSAYLNYLVFDKDHNLIDDKTGYVGLSSPSAFNEQTINVTDLIIDEPGYIYMYVSNESNSTNYVFFDSLAITHKEGRVTQSTDYYPFGLQTSDSWTRTWSTPNKHLYNGASELNEDTKNYETFYRPYDPQIGRFTQVDVMAAKYRSSTPYNYAFNDPVALNDPSGADPFWEEAGGYNSYTDNLGSSGIPGSMGGNDPYQMYRRGAYTGGFAGSVLGEMYNRTNHYWGLANAAGIKERYNRRVMRKRIGSFVSSAMAGNGGFWHHSTSDMAFFFDDTDGGDGTALAFGINNVNRHNAWGNTEYGSLDLTASMFNINTGRIDFTIGNGDLDFALACNGCQGGNTKIRNPYDYGTSISLSGNLTLLGGFAFELGIATDSNGDRSGFFTIGPSFGFDVSIGVLGKAFESAQPRIGFDVTDLEGFGASWDAGVLMFDYTHGGDLPDENAGNIFTDFGINSYTETGGGVSYGSPVGATYNINYTWTFGTKRGKN